VTERGALLPLLLGLQLTRALSASESAGYESSIGALLLSEPATYKPERGRLLIKCMVLTDLVPEVLVDRECGALLDRVSKAVLKSYGVATVSRIDTMTGRFC